MFICLTEWSKHLCPGIVCRYKQCFDSELGKANIIELGYLVTFKQFFPKAVSDIGEVLTKSASFCLLFLC